MKTVVRALTLLGLLGLGAVTLAHPSATRLSTWPWALFTDALWLLPIVVLCFAVGRGCELRCPAALVSAGLGLLALATLLSASVSPFAAASLPLTWPTLGGVALSLWLHHWLTEPGGYGAQRLESIALLVAVSGALIAAASLVAWLRGASPSLWVTRNTFPFGHSTYTGGFIVITFPWLLLRVWRVRGLPRLAWIAAAVAALFALAGTSSRGAVAGLGFAGAIGVITALHTAPWSRTRKIMLIAGALAIGAGAVGANPRLRELVVHRSWSASAQESNRQRSAMLDAGVRLGRERPLVGWGPGSVPLVYPRVRAQLEGGVANVLQLHNSPIQIWATLGALGLIAMVLLLGGMGAAIRRLMREPDLPVIPLTAFASLAGYGLFALTDHQFDLPIIAAIAAANLAVISAAAPPNCTAFKSRRARLAFLAGVVGVLTCPAVATVRDLRARAAFDAALTAMATGVAGDILRALDRATALAPQDPFFQHQAAGWLLEAAEKEPPGNQRTQLSRAAANRLEASLQAGAHLEYAHFNLGWLNLELNEPASAARHFIAAARLVPDKGGVYFGLGLALEAAGQRTAAVRAFALEWLNDPQQLTSPSWEVPALAALRPSVQAEALQLYAQLRRSYPPAAQAEAWTRWWLGETIPPADLAPGFSSEADTLSDAMMTVRAALPLPPSAVQPWEKLFTAWRQAGAPGVFTRAAGGDADLAAALARRAARHRDSFQSYLCAPTEDETALVRTSRRERRGYGVLARHPEGPILSDLYVVQENRVMAEFARGLFPPKGWLPGRFLLALLPPDPR